MIDVETSSLLDLFRKLCADSGLYAYVPSSVDDVTVIPDSDYSFYPKRCYDWLCALWTSCGVFFGISLFANVDDPFHVTYCLRFVIYGNVTSECLFFKEWPVTDSHCVEFDIHYIEPSEAGKEKQNGN